MSRFILCALLTLAALANTVHAYKIEVLKTPAYGWVMTDDSGNPFIIKGVCYSPTPAGKGVWDYNLYSDDPSIRFVDADKMQAMGANALRIYHPGKETEGTRKFIRQLYNLYSIYTIFPLPLEMQGADFASDRYRNRLKLQILNMVREYKDTPGVLVWLLGNEIDYFLTEDKAFWENKEIQAMSSPYKKTLARAKIVFDFANEIAKEIKAIDPNHPVGLSLGTLNYFKLLPESITDIDFIGLNYYQGKTFSSVWGQTRKIDKPILITEFGYDAFNTKKGAEDEAMQSKFIVSLWKDIEKNTCIPWIPNASTAGSSANGAGNAISLGGCIFEWTDEWWKTDGGDTAVQDTEGSWVNPAWPDFVDGKPNVQEEWFGIFKIEPSEGKMDNRTPRQVYFSLKEIWNAAPPAPLADTRPSAAENVPAPAPAEPQTEAIPDGYEPVTESPE